MAKNTRWRWSALLAMVLAVVVLMGWNQTAWAQEAVFRLGGNVVVAAEERLIGDVAVVGGSIRVLGVVTGDVTVMGGSVQVEGRVDGDVVALGGSVRLGESARVLGDVTVVGGTLERHPQSFIGGEVQSVSVGESWRFGLGDEFRPWFSFWRHWPVALLTAAAMFALAALVVAWMPDRVHAVEQHMETNAGRSFVIGLIALLLVVPLTLVLVLTIIGPPLLWVGFGVALLFGYVALVSLVGRKLSQRFFPNISPMVQLLAGVLVLAVLRFVPLLGGLLGLLLTMWSVGAVLDTKFGSNRPWIPPRQA